MRLSGNAAAQLSDAACRKDEERQHRNGDEGQAPVHPEDHEEGRDDNEAVRRQGDERAADDPCTPPTSFWMRERISPDLMLVKKRSDCWSTFPYISSRRLEHHALAHGGDEVVLPDTDQTAHEGKADHPQRRANSKARRRREGSRGR